MIIIWKNTLYAGQGDPLGMNGFGVFNWSALTSAESDAVTPWQEYAAFSVTHKASGESIMPHIIRNVDRAEVVQADIDQ